VEVPQIYVGAPSNPPPLVQFAILHITSNYKFTGYDILPDYGVFDIFKNPDIPRALEDYRRHLEKHCL
jgi:hypothetical protein